MAAAHEQPLHVRKTPRMASVYILLSKVENLYSNRSPSGPSKPLLFCSVAR